MQFRPKTLGVAAAAVAALGAMAAVAAEPKTPALAYTALVWTDALSDDAPPMAVWACVAVAALALVIAALRPLRLLLGWLLLPIGRRPLLAVPIAVVAVVAADVLIR